MICKALRKKESILPKIRVIATLLAVQLVLQHFVCIVKFHVANFLTSTVCFQMPQGQFTKTKHKLLKLKKNKKPNQNFFLNPVNQEILNIQRNHNCRENCPSSDLRVFPF